MYSLKIVDETPTQNLPDLTGAFASELTRILNKLQETKQNEFDRLEDIKKALMHYAIIMIYEYQEKGSGTVPRQIVDNIWKQVSQASQQAFDECNDEAFLDQLTHQFEEKLQNPEGISETIDFWDYYKL